MVKGTSSAWRAWGALVVVLAGACSTGGGAAITPRLRVTAQPFALVEVARRVGLDRVTVSDHGGVVVNTGGDPDPWLDPVAMEAVTDQVARTLSAADPGSRPAYQAAARAYRAQLGALDIEYRSSLADCGRHDIVTADQALARTAARYGFADHSATDPGVADVVRSKGIPVVFTEPGVTDAAVRALAQATHIRIDQLDTTVVRTPEEAARGATYLSLMADNLAKIRTALACTTGSPT